MTSLSGSSEPVRRPEMPPQRPWTVVARDVANKNPRIAKNALQEACDGIQYGRPPNQAEMRDLQMSLSRQMDTDETLLLRWVYKLIALTGEPRYVTYLVRQMRDRDYDPENRSWAMSALGAIDPDNFSRALGLIDEDLKETYDLARQMFTRTPVTTRSILRALEGGDDLTQQWLALMHGAERLTLPESAHRDLIRSRTASVAEYALWALRRRVDEHGLVLTIYPSDISKYPENVRRWYYQAFCADLTNITVFFDQVNMWIETEAESRPREGLARGLARNDNVRPWSNMISDWIYTESDPFVVAALSPAGSSSSARITRSSGVVEGGAAGVHGGSVQDLLQLQEGTTVVYNDNSVNIFGGQNGDIQGAMSKRVDYDARARVLSPDEILSELKGIREVLVSSGAGQSAAAVSSIDSVLDEPPSAKVSLWARLPAVIASIRAVAGLETATVEILDAIQKSIPT